VQDCYATCGRPSVDPVVFFKLQLVFLGYNLDEPLPDHSSLTRICTHYGVDVFRRFFEAIVEQCQQARLVWGRELYFDAAHALADASLDSLVPRFGEFALTYRGGIDLKVPSIVAEAPTWYNGR
jgi:hypothetical protein